MEAPDCGFEVVVADGNSDDGSRDILRRLAEKDSRLRVIDNPGRIVSSGLNAAIRAARADIIARADAHTEYAPDYLLRCLDALQQTGADNVGGPWVARGSGYISEAIAAAFQSPFAIGGARTHNASYEGPIDTVYLGCWRKEAFTKFGCFDEELVRNQDDEHNLRIFRGGGKIWQSPKIRSWYKPRASLSALFKQYAQYGYWKVRVIQKHKLPASWRHLVPAAFLLTMMLLVLSAVICPRALWLLVGALGSYLLAVLAASLFTAARAAWALFPVLPLVFVCYHFGYGFGFLRGIWDFVIWRAQPRPSFSHLTR
jgi:succinoglycan biosynthesis protein ExoA